MQVSRERVEFHVRGRGKIYLYYTIYSGEPTRVKSKVLCFIYLSVSHVNTA